MPWTLMQNGGLGRREAKKRKKQAKEKRRSPQKKQQKKKRQEREAKERKETDGKKGETGEAGERGPWLAFSGGRVFGIAFGTCCHYLHYLHGYNSGFESLAGGIPCFQEWASTPNTWKHWRDRQPKSCSVMSVMSSMS